MKVRRSTLESLFAAHRGKVSDKWSIYIAEYDRLFQPYRDHPVRLLEIGIQNGGSLEVWNKFFPNAQKIVGSDINPACAQLEFDDPKIAVVVADANTDEAQQRILAHSSSFDLIIDDGSHQSGDIVRSFARYFSHLVDGGLYIAEDLHCSYWKDFDGGIFQPYSSIAFFKRLADTVNHEHWGVEKTRSELLESFNRKYDITLGETTLAHIHSIEFINSLCVIRKERPENNVLGLRFIAGEKALVWDGALQLHGSSNVNRDQRENQWTMREAPIEEELMARIEEIATLHQRMSERDGEINNINQANVEHEQVHLAQLSQAQHQIEAQLLQLAECEKASSEQLQQLQLAHEQQKNEQSREHAAREQTHLTQLNQARQQIEDQLLQLEEREKASSEQLQQLQLAHEQQKSEKSREHAEREQAYLAQLSQTRRQIEAQLLQLAEREKVSSEQLQQLQQVHDQQKSEQSSKHAEREQAHLAQLGQARQQIEAQLLQLAEREKAFSGQLQHMQQAHTQQTNEQSRERALHEKNQLSQLALARQQIDTYLLELAKREKTYTQHLQEIQQTHEWQKQELSHKHAEQEKAHLVQLALARQKLEAHLLKLAEREKKFSQQLHAIRQTSDLRKREHTAHLTERDKTFSRQLQEIQQAHEHQKSEQIRAHAERERAHFAQLDQARVQIEAHLLELAGREKAFSTQLQAMHLAHEQQKNAQGQQHAEREQAHTAQLTLARQQIEAHLLQLVEREKAFSEQLQKIQQTHDQQTSTQSQQHAEREQTLNEQLAARKDELRSQINHWAEIEKAHALAVNELHSEMNAIRSTFSWRWTAPLRTLAAALGQQNLGKPQTVPALAVNDVPANDRPTDVAAQATEIPTLSYQRSSNTDNRILDMNLSQTKTAASSIDELLSYHDERFIHNAYQTILGRAPDSEGLRYYLERVRAGISKVEILAQLRLSTEGRGRRLNIASLDSEIQKYQRFKHPMLGPVVRLFNEKQEGGTQRKLRAIDNKLHSLDAQLQLRFSEMNHFFAELQQNVLTLGGEATKKIEHGTEKTINGAIELPAAREPQRYDPIGDRYNEALIEIKGRFARPINEISRLIDGVIISLIMPVYKVPLVYLEKAINSVKFQKYGNWELCIVDDGSNDPQLARFLSQIALEDSRIKIDIATVNRGISAATNAAISMATGAYIAFLDNDDILTNDALSLIAAEIKIDPSLDLIYSDECKIDENDNPIELFTKPDWSPLALFNCMYTGHLSVYRKTIVEQAGGMRSEFDFSQDYDLALRVSELTEKVCHINSVLYGWRMIAGSGAQGDKPYARVTNIAALQDTAIRRGISGQAVAEPTANHLRMTTSLMSQMVSIIIPSDNLKNIQATIDSICKNSLYTNYEIIVVTNSKLIKELLKDSLPPNLILAPFDKEFNFSEKCNVGAEKATGEIIVFFNDDVRVVSQDWIEMILECFVHQNVGIVGPKLLYENYLIQHAGMVSGVRGLVGTAFHCLPHETTKHFGAALWLREVSLICGACLAIRSDLFKLIDGFDAVNAPISHSDVDLCFRARDAGYSCLYTPHATLIHIGHMSIGETEKKESLKPTKRKKDKSDIFLLRRWGHHTSYDPYFPPAMRDILYHDSPEKWQLHASVPPAAPGGKDILLISHDLSGSGAPRIVFEMARTLREEGHFVVVASPSDGIYREQLNAIGIPVIIDELLLRQHDSLERFAKNFDFAIANTVVTWPAVKQLSNSIDVYWYIHEISLLQHLLNIQPEIKDVFTVAKNVWVGSAHAAELILPYRADVLVLKYGVIPPTDAKNEPSEPLRISLFGSYEPRKGQDLAVAAFASLSPEYRSKLRLHLFGRVLDESFYHAVERASRGIYEITLKTELPYERYVDELIASHAVLVASRDDTLPFVSIDALGAGKVLMCTGTTGTSSYIEHGVSGFISALPESNAIANMLREVVDRAVELRSVGLSGRNVFDTEFSVSAFKSAFFAACEIANKPVK